MDVQDEGLVSTLQGPHRYQGRVLLTLGMKKRPHTAFQMWRRNGESGRSTMGNVGAKVL